MLEGKVVVITGGAGLLGAVFCRKISDLGGVAIVADRDFSAAKRIADSIMASGGIARAHEIDITDQDSISRLIDASDAKFGKIDALVNSAYPRNKNWGRHLEDVTYADFCENLNLHLGGYFLTSQQFAVYFRKKGIGNIINIASIYGIIAPRFEVYEGTKMTMPVEYAAIKSAVIHMTKYFAQYYKKSGIRSNVISPGGILDQQPTAFIDGYASHAGTRGMLEKTDIAGTLAFLISDDSRYITGQNIIVDDGYTLA